MSTATNCTIPVEEVIDVFRQALDGKITVEPVTVEWWEAYCGDVGFYFGDWLIVFFNDCMELDYVDNVTAPDGRTAQYSDWLRDPIEVFEQQSVESFWKLENLIADATRGKNHMAHNTRKLVRSFADAVGIDPNIVSSISLYADARDAILEVRVGVIPQATEGQFNALWAALKEYSPEAAFTVCKDGIEPEPAVIVGNRMREALLKASEVIRGVDAEAEG